MKVYRLEHKESRLGFWQHRVKMNSCAKTEEERIKLTEYYFTDEAESIKDRCADHPTTGDDIGYEFSSKAYNQNWIHGCYTIEQFFAWFDTDWYKMIEYGFGLFEYEIEDRSEYFIGKYQVVFNPRVAVSRTELSIAEYEEALK